MRTHAALIVNPTSGRAQGQRTAREVARKLDQAGLAVGVFETTQAGDARQFAKDVAAQVDVIASVGGDGTLNEVVNGVLDSGVDTPVAVIPSGTANVVAAELRLPWRLEDQVRLVWDSAVRRLDLGLAGERLFAMCAGIGFDANVVDHVARHRTDKGITVFDYYLPTLTLGMEYAFPHMRVFVDEELVDPRSTFTVIGNMRRYAGPFSFFLDDAQPDDGVLNVCCLHGKHPLDLVRWGWGAFFRQFHNFKDVSHFSGQEIRVESDEDVLVQIDGDCGGSLPMTFRVLPGAVGFCVPPPR